MSKQNLAYKGLLCAVSFMMAIPLHNASAEIADPVYRDGVLMAWELLTNWHAGITYRYDNASKIRYVIHSKGSSNFEPNSVAIESWDKFLNGKNYMGSTCPAELSKGIRELIISDALDQLNASYFAWGPFTWGWKRPNSSPGYGDGIFRCDGLVEWCYEQNGYDFCNDVDLYGPLSPCGPYLQYWSVEDAIETPPYNVSMTYPSSQDPINPTIASSNSITLQATGSDLHSGLAYSKPYEYWYSKYENDSWTDWTEYGRSDSSSQPVTMLSVNILYAWCVRVVDNDGNPTVSPFYFLKYESVAGSLSVTINPAGAVSGGAQWQVDGGSWQNSGATVSSLSVGAHTVVFKPVNGYNAPSNQNVAINNDQTTSVSVFYTAVVTSDFNYTINNGKITITKYTGSGGEVVIPSEINGLPVVSIGAQAFGSCDSVTSVLIPDSVVSIENQAFVSCDGLASIIIGNGVISIGAQAFASCDNLFNVSIPVSVTNIGTQAFASCNNLGNVVIGNGVKKIDSSTFASCGSLTNVVIGKGVAVIESGAFSLCSNLEGIYFMGNAPVAGSTVFFNADNAIVYRPAKATGWPPVPGLWAGRPTALWIPPYILTVKDGFGGGTYTNGQQVIITANPPERGYRLKHWLVDGIIAGKGQKNLTVEVTGDMTIAAIFESVWLVFEGRSQMQRLDETGGKRGEPVVLKEALSTLLVVNRDRPGETNAVLISWGKGDPQSIQVAVSLDDSYPVSAKTDKAGLPAAERNFWALSFRSDGGKSLLLGTFDGAYRYDKAGVLTRVQQRASLNGAGLSQEEPSSGTFLLRLNQKAGDALNNVDGDHAQMEAVLRAAIKKLPAGVSAVAIRSLLQQAAGE